MPRISPSFPPSRSGMTAIELLVVMGIMAGLSSMAVSGIIGAYRRAALGSAISTIIDANDHAQAYARYHIPPPNTSPPSYYGVRIRNEGERIAIETIKADPLLMGGASVLNRTLLPRTMRIFRGNSQLSSDMSWFLSYGTGYPINPLTALPRPVGASPPGTSEHLSVRSVDGRMRTAVSVYEIGIVVSAPF